MAVPATRRSKKPGWLDQRRGGGPSPSHKSIRLVNEFGKRAEGRDAACGRALQQPPDGVLRQSGHEALSSVFTGRGEGSMVVGAGNGILAGADGVAQDCDCHRRDLSTSPNAQRLTTR